MTIDTMHRAVNHGYHHREDSASPRKPVKEKQERFNNALKVYIKNLPPNDPSCYADVMEHFSTRGNVLHEHFFEKNLAGHKIFLGLLVFSTEEEAEQATELTGTIVGGRHMIVSRYRQYAQPTSAKKVVVSKMSADTDEEDLWQFFENCGTIKYIHIERPLNACTLNAEVHFKTEKGALKALKLSGDEVKGNEVVISRELGEQEKSDKEFPVLVNGLSHEVQKDDLVAFFEGCGPIIRVKIKRRQQEEEAMATIFFPDSKSAKKAVACNGRYICGRVASVTERAEGVLPNQFGEGSENAVYLAGISKETKNVDIFLKFQDCGLINDIKFAKTQKGHLKKAVIEFKDYEGVNKALAMCDLELNGQNIVVGRSRDIWSAPHLETATSKGSKSQKHKIEEDVSDEESTPKMKKKKKKKDAATN